MFSVCCINRMNLLKMVKSLGLMRAGRRRGGHVCISFSFKNVDMFIHSSLSLVLAW
jgi:hypothetical protein